MKKLLTILSIMLCVALSAQTLVITKESGDAGKTWKNTNGIVEINETGFTAKIGGIDTKFILNTEIPGEKFESPTDIMFKYSGDFVIGDCTYTKCALVIVFTMSDIMFLGFSIDNKLTIFECRIVTQKKSGSKVMRREIKT